MHAAPSIYMVASEVHKKQTDICCLAGRPDGRGSAVRPSIVKGTPRDGDGQTDNDNNT